MKYSRVKLGKTKVGQVLEVTWVDIHADSTHDGSSKDLVDNYQDITYRTLGYFIGINKKKKVLILSNDVRHDKEDEYRGTMYIPLSVISEFRYYT